jgi:quinol monooxygenase YgiN
MEHPMTTPLTIVAICKAVPGGEDRLRAAQETLVAETVREPGCIRYELNQSLDNGCILIFIESWASEELWRAHMQSTAIKRFQASGAPNLIAEFELHRLTLVSDGSANGTRSN